MSTEPSVLLTGGTGFIGVPLCRQLLLRGYQVTVLSRQPKRAMKLLPSGVNVTDDLSKIERSFSHVVNLAGEPLADSRWSQKSRTEFYVSRIGTTESLLKHFREHQQVPEVVISGSAIGFYGHRRDEILTERESVGAGFAARLCRDWEAAALRFVEFGSRVCLVRTGIVLGGDGGALAKMLPAFKVGLGGRLGNGNQWMSWIHREDLVRLLIFCLKNPSLTGAINGVAPIPVTNRDFTSALGRALHRPALMPMPAIALRLLLGEMADELLLASQRVIPQAAEQAGFIFNYPALAAAFKEILQN